MENRQNIWLVIPVFNNSKTIKKIVDQSFNYINKILVIDDGSTDDNLTELLKDTKVKIIRHENNRGKGAAILTALDYLSKKNAESMITMDADGQHLPEDIPSFINAVHTDQKALFIGARNFNQSSIPGTSRFGRKFSNMWFKIETGKVCSDTQSGFRAYPVNLLSKLNLHGSFYDFEIEVIARASWAGIPIREINISVVYEKGDARVSHFRKIKDNWRITLMHTRLVGRKLVPLPHKQLVDHDKKPKESLLLHPIKFFKMLLKENTSPMELAVSAATGSILAVLPLIGLHSVAIIYVTARLHLNKIMALSIQVLYSPPFVPFVCIEAGHYIRTGTFILDLSFEHFKLNLHNYFFDWVIGSFVLAPLYGIVAYFAVYFIASKIQKKMDE
ncbi:MAG: glycosyl transferase family 2 [Rhodospirillaceae bacterium]|jgi:glycosyltransferase involved in cell wall biosynthesis|nr:glycosyl transferase family 2 [Rhodospirillaceae bacterium]|tara:strand:+ start:10378 stop:11541 length:1164 start_codon:yes stop_codon:yes gene_type:complete